MNLNQMEEIFDQIRNIELSQCQIASPTTSKLKSALTNLAFTLKNNCIFQLPFSLRTPLQFSSEYQRVYLLGKVYDTVTRDQFYNSFQQVIWFTYRRLSKCQDVGWGCMIRVIQMMIAQVITRDQPNLPLDQVIDFFRQQGEGQLALSTICKMGNLCKKWINLAARWTSCPQILSIVSSILFEMQKIGKIKFTFQFYCDQLEIRSPQEYSEEDFPKLIAIHSKVGEEKTIDTDYLSHLVQLMKDKRFVGFASGHKTEALYVLGIFNNQAIILDPHYVQQQETFDTFFCKNPQGIPFNELASGISISFYIPTLEDFYQWVEQMIYCYRISLGYSCFKVKVQGEENWGTGRRKGSDDFQVLLDQ